MRRFGMYLCAAVALVSFGLYSPAAGLYSAASTGHTHYAAALAATPESDLPACC